MRFGRCAAAAFLFALYSGIIVRGATVTYTLSINDNGNNVYTPGDFAIYAADSTEANNDGLAYFYVSVIGYAAVANVAPQTTYEDGGDSSPAGFTLGGSTGGSPITAEEDTIHNGVTLIYGYGQSAGNFNSFDPYGSDGSLGATTGNPWGAHVLLATGDYTGTVPTFGAPNTANYFTTNTTSATASANIGLTTVTLTPEPGALGLLGIAVVGLIGRRRSRVRPRSAGL